MLLQSTPYHNKDSRCLRLWELRKDSKNLKIVEISVAGQKLEGLGWTNACFQEGKFWFLNRIEIDEQAQASVSGRHKGEMPSVDWKVS